MRLLSGTLSGIFVWQNSVRAIHRRVTPTSLIASTMFNEMDVQSRFSPCGAGHLMTDIVDRAVRSRMMAGIGGRDTKPELILRRALHARGLRYRLHDRKLPGTPDLVFRRFGAVCFVHGCFWHRHEGCPYTTDPATRPEFWQAKFRANVERDRRCREDLLEAGWRVAIVWECALRKDEADWTSLTLDQWLRGGERNFETTLEWNRQSGRQPS